MPSLINRVCPQSQYRVSSFAEHFYVNGVIKLRTVYKTYETKIPVCCPSFIQVVDECIGKLVVKFVIYTINNRINLTTSNLYFGWFIF